LINAQNIFANINNNLKVSFVISTDLSSGNGGIFKRSLEDFSVEDLFDIRQIPSKLQNIIIAQPPIAKP